MDASRHCKFVNGKCVVCGFEFNSDKQIYRKCTPTSVEYPSILEMGTNLINSAIDFIEDGFSLSSKEEVNRKVSICQECNSYDRDKNRCKECGCFISIASLINSKQCPLGKW